VGEGLGSLLEAGRSFYDMGMVLATMVLIMAIGVLFNELFFTPLEKDLRKRWGIEG
jgi:ABC-type nitrate/sulfonate/bicarbonate transport system permease component